MLGIPNPPRPILTLTSDFGLADTYVAAMKAAILRFAPEAMLVDITHEIPPQDVVAASFAVERALDAFAPGTIHLAVVDPGVGTQRRILVVEMHRQLVVCPDNGLITWAWRRLRKGKAHKLDWRPKTSSNTFHGRDIMAPSAAMLAAGRALREIASPIRDPILLEIRPARPPVRIGRIIHVDHFGNATTNVPRDALPKTVRISVKNQPLGPLKRTYSDVPAGQPLALIGSAYLLEIAVRNGSAAKNLSLKVGDPVRIFGASD